MSEWASSVIREHLEFLAGFEKGFGPATALLMYGRQFEPVAKAPHWFKLGTRKECYKNAAHLALNNDEVRYAEGYAIDLDLPMPIEHAWVVDLEGRVIDPTWPDSDNYDYFGVSFNKGFLSKMLSEAKGATGLLPDPVLIRTHFGTPELFEAAMAYCLPELSNR